MAERANKGFNGRPGKGGKIKHRPTLAFPLTIIAGENGTRAAGSRGLAASFVSSDGWCFRGSQTIGPGSS